MLDADTGSMFFCSTFCFNPHLPVVQISVLTDQVEVQGEKIRDLDTCLEHHRDKLNATEELLQQVASTDWTKTNCGGN